jgi:cytosine/adenosine deaminase-related metal-dependent hydrolase
MFAQMRLGLADARAEANALHHAEGRMPETLELTARDALRWATVNGAEAMGLGAVTGSITPGKQADLVVLGSDRVGWAAAPEAAGSAVFQAGAADVRDVLVAGRVVKRDGALLGHDVARARRLVDQSRERVTDAVLAAGPILPPPIPDFAEQLNQLALANLAS